MNDTLSSFLCFVLTHLGSVRIRTRSQIPISAFSSEYELWIGTTTTTMITLLRRIKKSSCVNRNALLTLVLYCFKILTITFVATRSTHCGVLDGEEEGAYAKINNRIAIRTGMSVTSLRGKTCRIACLDEACLPIPFLSAVLCSIVNSFRNFY